MDHQLLLCLQPKGMGCSLPETVPVHLLVRAAEFYVCPAKPCSLLAMSSVWATPVCLNTLCKLLFHACADTRGKTSLPAIRAATKIIQKALLNQEVLLARS